MAEVTDPIVAAEIVRVARLDGITSNGQIYYNDLMKANDLVGKAQQAIDRMSTSGRLEEVARRVIELSNSYYDPNTRAFVPNGKTPNPFRRATMPDSFVQGAARIFAEGDQPKGIFQFSDLRSGSTIGIPDTKTLLSVERMREAFASTAANARAATERFAQFNINQETSFTVDQTTGKQVAEAIKEKNTMPQYASAINTDDVEIGVGNDSAFSGQEFIDRLEELGGEWSREKFVPNAGGSIERAISDDPYFPGIDVTGENRAEVVRIIELLVEIDGIIENDVEDAQLIEEDSIDGEYLKNFLRDRNEFGDELERASAFIDWDAYATNYFDGEFGEIIVPTMYGQTAYKVKIY